MKKKRWNRIDSEGRDAAWHLFWWDGALLWQIFSSSVFYDDAVFFALRDLPKFGEISPTVDIFEEGKDLVVKAELSGMKKDDLNFTITENRGS